MESEYLESLIEKYKLSEEEHRVILEKLKESIFSTKTPARHNSAMFVIGQPGCGKTTFIQNTDSADYININSDDYRHFSKYSDEILKNTQFITQNLQILMHIYGEMSFFLMELVMVILF